MIRTLGQIGAHLLFWGWNVLLVSLILFGLGPTVMFECLHAAWIGLVPWSVALFLPGMVLISTGGMLLGLWKLRRDPGRLLTLFYGVQFPLLAVFMIRVFGVNELIPATGLALGAFVLGALGLLRTVLVSGPERHPAVQAGRLVAQSLYLGIGLWVAMALGVLLVPLGCEIAGEIWRSLGRSILESNSRFFRLRDIPLVLFGLVNVGVFLLFPFAMVGLSVRGWSLVRRDSRARFSSAAVNTMSVASIGLFFLFMGLVSRQPQHRAMELLAGDVETALDNEALIHDGLMNMRLSRYRYLGTRERDHHKPQVRIAQALALPFLYDAIDDQWSDQGTAEELYAGFFDAPMLRAERDVIAEAMQSTWNWEQAAAGLLDVGEQRVWLESQEMEVEAQGDHATITLHEVYRNKTWQDEEVLVYFSLPEGAVVSGLWLGGSAEKSEAFTHVVAPRGAAQEVYENEVRRSRDPALLEQVGPRQYRLRAFPILERDGARDELSAMTELGPAFHLWVQFDVWSVEVDGEWVYPLPQASEVRNLFWDDDSERMAGEGWLPASVPGAAPAMAYDQGVRVDPAPARVASSDRDVQVVVDTSYSMRAQREALEEALQSLASAGIPVPEVDGLRFHGGVPLETQLRAVRSDAEVLLVLTDRGSYELNPQDTEPLELPELWLVHLDGLPQAYGDGVLDTLKQTGGGVGTSVDEVLLAMNDVAPVRDGRAFHVEGPIQADGALGRLLARQVIEQTMEAASAAEMDERARLDAVHALAVEHDLVTPWSSMIVLVNEAQREALKEASEGEDAFERETLDSKPGASLMSTPEPGEWVLLACGALILLWSRKRPVLQGV